jgi:phosphocarrier protein FPr
MGCTGVLRMVDRTVQAATAAGKWVGCADRRRLAGGDPGRLGVTELSVSIPSIAAIKAQVRLPWRQRLARQALACRTAAEVRSLPL